MTHPVIEVGGARLTRVTLTDADVPADLVGLSAEQISALDWATPAFAADGNAKVGVAIWILERDGVCIAFDPMQAADSVLRANPAAEAAIKDQVVQLLTDAGYPPARIDALLLTHVDGVGMAARCDDGAWSPFFPNARIVMSAVERAGIKAFTTGPEPEELGSALVHQAFGALLALDVIDPFEDGADLPGGVIAEVRGGHGEGHTVFGVAPGVHFIGHLAVSPVHFASGECAQMHEAPGEAHEILTGLAQTGETMIGPLFPAPGYGHWNGTRFVAAAA